MATDRSSWVSLSLPSRRVVVFLNLAFKWILFYAWAISCLQSWNRLSRVTEFLPKGDDLEGCRRGFAPKKQSSVTRLSSTTQPPFLALISCPHFSFQIPRAPMSSSLQPLIYLLSFASRVPLQTWLGVFALGVLRNCPSSRSMKLHFSLSPHCSLLSSGILVAPLILPHSLLSFDCASA